MQLLEPDQYAKLKLPDQFVEDWMQEVEARYLIERLKNCNTILELGWGSGILAKALVSSGKRVTVIEGAAEFANEAIKHVDSVIHDTFEQAAFAEHYDCVIASFVLEHVADPIRLLKRARTWANKLVAVIGNANSYHRQLAVSMGLQPKLESLSDRDKQVGHYKVYTMQILTTELLMSRWTPVRWKGLMLKPLPNSMLAKLPKDVVKAMCEAKVEPQVAANIVVECV